MTFLNVICKRWVGTRSTVNVIIYFIIPILLTLITFSVVDSGKNYIHVLLINSVVIFFYNVYAILIRGFLLKRGGRNIRRLVLFIASTLFFMIVEVILFYLFAVFFVFPTENLKPNKEYALDKGNCLLIDEWQLTIYKCKEGIEGTNKDFSICIGKNYHIIRRLFFADLVKVSDMDMLSMQSFRCGCGTVDYISLDKDLKVVEEGFSYECE